MKPSILPCACSAPVGAVMALVGFALAALSSRADTLVQYSFTGGSLVATSFDSADFASASNVTRGSTFNSPSSFATDWVYALGSQTPSSDPASSSSAYFTFTLTPKSGVVYSLTSLTFDAAFYESGGASNTLYTTNYSIRSSVLDYSTNIATFAEAGQTATTPVFHTKTVDLSGLNYQSIGGTAITFRIYIWDGITGGTRLSSIDNLTLNGTVSPIPEPSACALMAGVAAVFFTGLRRRRRRFSD